MFYGLLDLPWWGYVIYTLILTHITIASVTIFLHRCQAHRSLTLHASVSHFFRLWLWLTTGMDTRAWTAIHRKHHAKCETVDDPHSPQVYGINKVLWEGAELYRAEAKVQETINRYGQGTPDDWLENNLYRPHSSKGFMIMLLANILLTGIPGIIVWSLQMAWIPFFACGIINGVGHYKGYRNFECDDASTNVSPWGILIGGEELHNNHHTYPTSAKLSIKWWEFDIGWLYISTLSFLGLAKVKRLPPKTKLVSGKSKVDLETLRALIANRFPLMAQYSKSVLIPTFNNEKSRMSQNAIPDNIKPTLIQDPALIDDKKRTTLENFLEHTQQLKVVYQFKERLLEIWHKTTASQKELLDSLQEWCQQAEATRIQCLQDFVKYLKSYTIVTAH